ncbi:MAG: ammonium transporter [Chloroflexi bacterium]|nr:ammonium transporter [Chloroflexota bacterium]
MPEINSGDTAWVLASAALVLIMTPALGFFYGGLARNKNVINTIMLSFIIVGVVGVQWVVFGYSLAFGPDVGGFIGNLEWFGLNNVGAAPHDTYFPTVPHEAFMVFQMMFAIITPALITGAFVERAKFSTFLVFTVLWATLVYDPVAHWVFAKDGWAGNLGGYGGLDFAGGTVIHVNSGFAALAAALAFGKRIGFGKEPMEPHNVTYVVLGAAILWFGWFGFNAGSEGAADFTATNAFVVTQVATATAAVTWMGMSWLFAGKPSVVGAAAGAVAGLVAITPASGFVQPMSAIAIGFGAGVFCYLAVRLRGRLGFDDSLDVWGVHGIGGAWGAFATGLFATTFVNALGRNGAIEGEYYQIVRQLIPIGAVAAYSFVMTFAILKVLDLVMGLRVTEEEEEIGVDVSEHGERGYVFDGGGAVVPSPAPASVEPRPPSESARLAEGGAAGGGGSS